MARMLYLRDIEVDVHVRCCACGHEGVLPRADLQRRFGPNYPVLSIAPHYRCSKCDSRDVESRPAPAFPAMAVAARAAQPPAAPSFDGPLAALQGLLDAVRGRGGEDPDEETPQDEEPYGDEPDPREADAEGASRHHPNKAEDGAAPAARPLLLEQLVAEGPPPADSARRPLWEPISLADMAARLTAEEEQQQEDAAAAGEDPSPLDRTIAALRGMIGDDDGREDETEEDALPPVFSPKALVRSDFDEDELEDDPGFDGEFPTDDADPEPSEDEILAFAIRDPEKAPPPWEREPVPDDQPLDKTIAALRDMVREAATDPADVDPVDIEPAGIGPEEPEDEPPPRFKSRIFGGSGFEDEPDDMPAMAAAPADADDSPEIEVAPEPDYEPEPEPEAEETARPRKSSQELEMEEALRALRALVEADDPDDHPAFDVRDGGHPPKQAAPRASGEPDGWDDEDAALDLVDELPGEVADEMTDDGPGPGERAAKDSKPDKASLSPLDKTIAALRGMLELDGKRGR